MKTALIGPVFTALRQQSKRAIAATTQFVIKSSVEGELSNQFKCNP
jgi:hypothetical protein